MSRSIFSNWGVSTTAQGWVVGLIVAICYDMSELEWLGFGLCIMMLLASAYTEQTIERKIWETKNEIGQRLDEINRGIRAAVELARVIRSEQENANEGRLRGPWMGPVAGRDQTATERLFAATESRA